MMVVIHHINFHTDWLREQAGGAPSALSNIPWSFGIHIFFVISGFIMILSTKNFGERGAWKRFLVRRILRIVPLYWILTTVMVVGVWLAPHSIEISGDRFWYIVGSYFFILVLRAPGDLRPILGQGWTLDYEMYFYLALALATLCTRRLGVGIMTAVFIALHGSGATSTSPRQNCSPRPASSWNSCSASTSACCTKLADGCGGGWPPAW
jgi:peptidoglycan/LPS O-acetylase OafA/YrhL